MILCDIGNTTADQRIIISVASGDSSPTTVLDEDNTPLDGVLFCGAEGRAVFALKDSKYGLLMSWYRMESGRYEIVSYVG